VNSLQSKGKFSPLWLGQLKLKSARAIDKGGKGQVKWFQFCREVPSPGKEGRDDLGNILVVEKFGQLNRNIVEGTASQLAKISRAILRSSAIDGGVQIAAQGQKGDLLDGQVIRRLQAGSDGIVWDEGFFKHEE